MSGLRTGVLVQRPGHFWCASKNTDQWAAAVEITSGVGCEKVHGHYFVQRCGLQEEKPSCTLTTRCSDLAAVMFCDHGCTVSLCFPTGVFKTDSAGGFLSSHFPTLCLLVTTVVQLGDKGTERSHPHRQHRACSYCTRGFKLGYEHRLGLWARIGPTFCLASMYGVGNLKPQESECAWPGFEVT